MLHRETVAAGIGRLETRVDDHGIGAALAKRIPAQSSEWAKVKVAGLLADSSAGSIGKLLRRKPGELLHVAKVHHRVVRNRTMAWHHHLVQMIYAVVGHRRPVGTGEPLCGNLGVREHRVDAYPAEDVDEGRGVAVEQPWYRDRLDGPQVGTPQSGNIARQAQAEVVIEVTPTPAHHRLRSRSPGKAEPRGNIGGGFEPRIVVPAYPQVEGQLPDYLPVVLQIQPVVIVAEADLVSLRRLAPNCIEREQTGINRSELRKVVERREYLIGFQVGFDSTHLGAQEIPTQLEAVASEVFAQADARGAVLLIEVRGRQEGTKIDDPQVPNQ